LHGAMLARLREVAPEAADLAHSLEPRPFSISGLYREGAHTVFSCAGLTDPVSQAIQEAMQAGTEMEIGPSRVRVLGVDREGTSYEELYERFVPQDEAYGRISLRFLSPTTFRVRKANMPFPLPRLLWRSWGARWNAFSRIHLGGFEEWVEEFIVPAGFRMRSRVVKVGGATLVGVVGECEYRVLLPESLEARIAAMLAEYARYCGTGQKTTMGMGATALAGSWDGRST
jgi:CRISPR-associated endoribonuclease Cas6